jgi:hypothetical protein
MTWVAPKTNWTAADGVSNADMNRIESNALYLHSTIGTFETAGGNGTALTLTDVDLVDGTAKSFVVSAANAGAATTLNGKPLYKPNSTTAPNLIAGRAVTVWYNAAGDCFFFKASASGTATADKVLAPFTISNDYDTDIVGTMPNRDFAWWDPQLQVPYDGGMYVIPPKGYFDGNNDYANHGGVRVTSPDFLAANILLNKTIFNKVGTLVPGRKFASGTVACDGVSHSFAFLNGTVNSFYDAVTVSGLTFLPSLIVLIGYNGSSNTQFIVYSANDGQNAYGYQKTVMVADFASTSGTHTTAYFKGDTNSASVTSTGFTLPASSVVTFKWFAFE